MYCEKCGTQNSDNARYCTSCGNNLKQGNIDEVDKVLEAAVSEHRNEQKKISEGTQITMYIEKFATFISWAMGAFFVLAAILLLLDSIFRLDIMQMMFMGFPCAVFSLLLFPPIVRRLQALYPHNISYVYRLSIFIVLLFVWALATPQGYLDEVNDTNTQITAPEAVPAPTIAPIQTLAPTQAPTSSPAQVQQSDSISLTYFEFDTIFWKSSSMTDLQKEDEFEKNYKGKIITWEGYIDRVYEGWTGDYCIWVTARSPGQSSVDFKSCFEGENNKNTLLSLQEGDHITIIGTIEDYQDLYPSYYVEGMQIMV